MGDLQSILAQLYQGKVIQLDPFTYSQSFAFTAAATVTNNISIQADSDFICLAGTYFVNVANAAQTRSGQNLFNGTVLLTDSGAGRQLMNTGITVDSLFGSGQFPFVWPQPKMLASKSTLQIQVTQNEATTQTLFLNFHGVKVFTLPGQMPQAPGQMLIQGH